jgi:glycosyltransferase involved in cell wall biosynthesis
MAAAVQTSIGRIPESPRIAVLIPCYNEVATIGQVVRAFQAVLPAAQVYVYDNNSTDGTATIARGAGATVRHEAWQGKGNVVRRMFADIDADIYLLVDGDDTYDASTAPILIQKLIAEQLDMVNAARVLAPGVAYRLGHRLGNRLLTALVGLFFGRRSRDMLSGYRALSRRFVKTFPILATGFEIETELTVHALELHMPIAEIEAPYRPRPPGSRSKISTFKDGFRILWMIGKLVKEERPMEFFSVCALLFAATSIGAAWPLFITYFETGQVPRFPTAILTTGLMLLAFLSLVCGLILDTVTRARRELKRLQYLGFAGPRPGDEKPE